MNNGEIAVKIGFLKWHEKAFNDNLVNSDKIYRKITIKSLKAFWKEDFITKECNSSECP